MMLVIEVTLEAVLHVKNILETRFLKRMARISRPPATATD